MHIKSVKRDDLEYLPKYNVYALRTYPWPDLAHPSFGSAWGVVHKGMETTPHRHEDEGETFYIAKGKGRMKIDDEEAPVEQGDCVFIPPGGVHSLLNTEEEDLLFIAVWWPADIVYTKA